MTTAVAHRSAQTKSTTGWKCNASLQRCVRGGTYIDDICHRKWRFLVGWHLAD
jgi:hypothetical protein